MKFYIALILTLTGLSLQAQTNCFSVFPSTNNPATNNGFRYVESFSMTNHEKSFDFMPVSNGCVMTFSCTATNPLLCEVECISPFRLIYGTNTVTWTNQTGESFYLIGCDSPYIFDLKTRIPGTTTGLKP
jgi:hypothetical protein